MSEEQRKVVYKGYRGSAVIDRDEIPIGGSAFILQNLDITPYDFTYLRPLIEDSYTEWLKECSHLEALKSFKWAVLAHDGSWMTGAEELGAYFAAGDDDTVARTLRLRKPAFGIALERLGGQVICSIPLLTRMHGDLFAVMISVSQPDESGGDRALLLTESYALLYRANFYRMFEHLVVKDLEEVHTKAEQEASRRSLLFQYVKRIHVQFDVDSVITEALDSILSLYPDTKVELYMSQDHQSTHPLVRQLLLRHWQEDVFVRTFMEGKLTVHMREESDALVEVGIPMGGRQGVYGVFHLEVEPSVYPDIDLELLSMMADAAGTSFENAKLYEQSNLMIHELRMMNELTSRLNKSLHLVEIFKYANQELLRILEADYCCILIYNPEQDGLEVVSSNAEWMLKKVFDIQYGLGGIVYQSKEAVILADYAKERMAESELMESTGSCSMVGTPLIINGEVGGVVLLTHHKPHYFSYDSYRLLQALTSHIGLAIGNAFLHAKVRRMANRDMLTGLYARHYLDEIIHTCQSRDVYGSLIVIDIDQFKQVNDTFGHQRGDNILKQVSGIVKSAIRHNDIPARWGGEELAVYLPGLGVMHAVRVAERIRSRVAEETDPRVTVSCGISEWSWTDDKVSVESLFYRADMALYEAKNGGRNRIVVEKSNID